MNNSISSYKPLLECIDDHLYWGRTWETLRPGDMEELAGHAVKAAGKESYLAIAESDDCDSIMHAIANRMVEGGNGHGLFEMVSNAAIRHYSKDLREIFTDRKETNEHEGRVENGLHPHINQQNGEMKWSRA